MKLSLLSLSLLFLLFLSLVVSTNATSIRQFDTNLSPLHAEDEPDVNVLNIPQQLSQHLGLPIFACQIGLSSAVLLSIALLLGFVKAKGILNLVVLFVALSGLVTIGWLPYWILILISLLVAVLYAKVFRRMI